MANGTNAPFQPAYSVSISASTTSSNVFLPGNGESVLVTNPTGNLAYFTFGSDQTLISNTTGTPVLPNSKLLLRCGPLVNYAAALLSAGNGTVFVTRGDGSTT